MPRLLRSGPMFPQRHSAFFQTVRSGLIFLSALATIAGFNSDALAQTTTRWTNPQGGDWEDPNNWDAGVPVSDDYLVPEFNVEIATASTSDYLINADVHGQFFLGQLDLDSSNATLNFTRGSSLSVFNDINLGAGRLHLERSRVRANAINLNGGRLTFSNNSTYEAEIEAAKINGYFEIEDARLELTHGALFTGDARIANSTVKFSDANVLLDSGQDIHLESGHLSSFGLNNSVLSIGRSVSVTGVGSISGRVFNHGRIETTANRQFGFNTDLYGKIPANLGTIVVAEGSTLNWSGVNRGTIELKGTLHSKLTRPNYLGDIRREEGSRMIFSSTWLNSGNEINLNSQTGDYILSSAQVYGGSVIENGARFIFADGTTNTFSNVDYKSNVRVTGNTSNATFAGNFKIGGDINILGQNSSVSFRTEKLPVTNFDG